MTWLVFVLFAGEPTVLTGKVVGVTDGDTLTLLVDRTQYKVRLSGDRRPGKEPALRQPGEAGTVGQGVR